MKILLNTILLFLLIKSSQQLFEDLYEDIDDNYSDSTPFTGKAFPISVHNCIDSINKNTEFKTCLNQSENGWQKRLNNSNYEELDECSKIALSNCLYKEAFRCADQYPDVCTLDELVDLKDFINNQIYDKIKHGECKNIELKMKYCPYLEINHIGNLTLDILPPLKARKCADKVSNDTRYLSCSRDIEKNWNNRLNATLINNADGDIRKVISCCQFIDKINCGEKYSSDVCTYEESMEMKAFLSNDVLEILENGSCKLITYRSNKCKRIELIKNPNGSVSMIIVGKS